MPELKIPEDLQQPTGSRLLMDVPEELDSGEIPKDLELPPTITGIELDDTGKEEKKRVADSEDEDTETAERKPTIKSEIISRPDNTQLLIVKSDIDTVWPRVGKAVKKMGFKIEDSNRGKFYYSIVREFEKLKTLQDPSKPVEIDLDTPKEEHLIYVEPGEAHTEITVRNAKSEIEGTVLTEQLLLQIKNIIEEQ